EHIMRNAESLGDPARVVYVLAGATGAGTVHGGAMVVKLERDADDIVAFALEKAGHDGRVHAAGHRHDDTGVFWSSRKVKTVHRPGNSASRRRLIKPLNAPQPDIGQGSAHR